jgi:type I restriction enzyme S subunit
MNVLTKSSVPNWERGKLSSFVKEFIVPQRDKPKLFDGEIPWCRIEDFNGRYLRYSKSGLMVSAKTVHEMSLRVYPQDTVLVSCSADLGRCAIVGRPLVTNQTFIGLVPSEKIHPLFLHYYMSYLAPQLNEMASGATIKYLSRDKFRNLDVAFPELREQRRIVGILDEACEGIATAKANAEKNLQNARALFEGYLQSAFAERGNGWIQKSLGSVANFRNGINFTQNSKGERITIVGVRNFQKNFFAPLNDLDSVTIDGDLNEFDSLKKNDILAVRSNGNIELIGRCLLVGDVAEKTSHSGFTIRIRLASDELLPSYLCHFMKSASTRKRLTEGGIGTNIKSLNQAMLSSLTVPFPSISEQKNIVRKLEFLSKESERLQSIYEQKLAALEALKKSLLHQAFSG